MTQAYEMYLFHEQMFWPLALMTMLRQLRRAIYKILASIPRKLMEFIYKEPAEILEWISAVGAMLLVVWAKDNFLVPMSWKILAGALGLIHFAVLIKGCKEDRFMVMIVATVFWWCYMFSLIPKRFTIAHVFLIPLCCGYIVTTVSLYQHSNDPKNRTH